MADTDTATAPAEEAPAAAPPDVRPAPPSQRSTGGVPREEPDDGHPPTLNAQNAQDLLRRAYKQTTAQRASDREEARDRAAERAAPNDEAVDTKGDPAVQRAQTPAPRAAKAPPTPARQRDTSTGRFQPAPQGEAPAEAPAAPPSTEPAPAAAQLAPPAPAAPAAAPDEAFQTDAWQQAFADDPGLKRRVARIRADPAIADARKAELLAEKLSESRQTVSAEQQELARLRYLRDANPPAFAQEVRQREAAEEQQRVQALQITRMIADAYGVPVDDPAFLAAGPEEGEGPEVGLQRFVEYTATKSPVLRQQLDGQIEARVTAVREEYEGKLKQQAERHAKQLEAAEERARARVRSPYQRNGAPPRTNGTGQVPVGEAEGLQVAQKAPDAATVRGLIGMGYQRRE